jgi:hypothetical protein
MLVRLVCVNDSGCRVQTWEELGPLGQRYAIALSGERSILLTWDIVSLLLMVLTVCDTPC